MCCNKALPEKKNKWESHSNVFNQLFHFDDDQQVVEISRVNIFRKLKIFDALNQQRDKQLACPRSGTASNLPHSPVGIVRQVTCCTVTRAASLTYKSIITTKNSPLRTDHRNVVHEIFFSGLKVFKKLNHYFLQVCTALAFNN